MKIGVIGLGLIGGSMAKAIKHYTNHTVFGMDTAERVVLKAKMVKVIDGEILPEQLGTCQLILVALYPHDTVDFIRTHAKQLRGTTVVDCSGVKKLVQDAAFPIACEHGFTFIGGHPMAGIEYSGFEYSKIDLFDGAAMILTPDPRTDIVVLDNVKQFFLSLGFELIRISTPEEHDSVIAYTSQLAHVLSSAYVKSELAMKHQGFSAGSFKDMTRVALLNDIMWTELFLANSTNLANEVEELAERLMQYAVAIRTHDAATLTSLLREGSQRKQYLMEREGVK